MENINELLGRLNEEQIKPVLDTEGAVLVIAGAGSGKTRVLTTRIAYLILEKGVSPSNILSITFTNKAANEMKERLTSYISDVSSMWVCTIHSMCVKILKSDIDKIGYDKNFTIYDETDKDKVLKRVIEELGYDVEKYLKLAKNQISIAKNECLSPEEYRKEFFDSVYVEEVFKIYRLYERRMSQSNALDFDDLLMKTYELFSKSKETADYYANKFKYIHIDEFQDTNKVQFLLAERLSLTHGNIFVVGDDDQSIYGWRGAKIDNILHFDNYYPNTNIYKLEKNYRSSKKILSLANCIIANNTERRVKELYTDNGDGANIETYFCTDENEEASKVAITIKSLIQRSNYNYKDFAVFMRVNALTRAFEQEFTKYGIKYKVYGGFRFFERKEIKDVLSYLKILVNHNDDESFLRAISSPKRGIGDKTLTELKEFCSSNYLPLYFGIDRIDETTLNNSSKTKLKNFKELIDCFYSYSCTHSISDLVEYILKTTDFMEQFSDGTEENENKIMNIDELRNSILEFEKVNDGLLLTDYLNSVTLSTDTDDINTDNAVTIATIHAVKGLEFPCVFVSGLDETILPLARSMGDDSELEEERRLMYVAITRAKDRLFLTRANSRYMYGERRFMTKSRFLKEGQIVLNPSYSKPETENLFFTKRDSVLFNENDDLPFIDSVSSGYSSSGAKKFLSENKPKLQENVSFSSYKSGTKVLHPRFGEGIVISTSGEGDNMICDIQFKGVGIKSLSLKFAPLEIIK